MKALRRDTVQYSVAITSGEKTANIEKEYS